MKTFLIAAALITMAAAGVPQLKDGLWSIHTQYSETPTGIKSETVTSYCRDRIHDEREKAATDHGKCKTISDTTTGNTRITETECPASDTIRKMKMTFTVISDSSTHTEMQTTFDPPSGGRSASTIITDQKFVGACPAGVGPGDILDASGKVIHHGKR